MFLFKPADKSGPLRKFARPYHGPYRVVEMDCNTARIRRVDKPEGDTILVALDRLRYCLRYCPEELVPDDDFWPRPKQKRSRKKANSAEVPALDQDPDSGDDTPEKEEDSPIEAQETVPVVAQRKDKRQRKNNQRGVSTQAPSQSSSTVGDDATESTEKTPTSDGVSKHPEGKWTDCLRRRPK